MLSGVRFCLILSGMCPAGCVCKSLLCPASPWAPWRTSCPPTSLNPEQGEEFLRERRQGAECRGPRVRAGSRPSALRGLLLLPASDRQRWSHPVSPPGVSGLTAEIFPVGPTVTGGWRCAFSLPAVPMAPVSLCAQAGVSSKILGHKSQKPDSNSPE